MNRKLVSIVTPVYNAEKYLSEMIQSVQSQSYKYYEHLLVDDCSTDSSIDIIKNFQKNDPKIKIFMQSVNGGSACARNRGIREAQGEYIAFLDADDRWISDKLIKQIEALCNNNEIYLIGTQRFFIDDKGTRLDIQDRRNGKYWGKYNVSDYIIDRIPITTSSVIVKKECLEKCGYFKEEYRQCQDFEIWFRIINEFKIGVLEDKLVEYRVHPENISKNKIKGKLSKVKIFENEVLPKLGLFGERKKEFLSLLQRYYISLGKIYTKDNQDTEANIFFEKAMKLNGGKYIYVLKGFFYKVLNSLN